MNRNQSAKSTSVYKTGSRRRSLYKKRRRNRRRSSRSENSTNSESKKKKKGKGLTKFLRRTLLMAVSAVGAYLVFSVVEAENEAGLLVQIIEMIRDLL